MDIDLHKTQQYIDWLKEKLYLNHIAKNAKNRQIRRGEVYQCKFGVGIGSEECKERPCLILQYDSANKTSPNTLVAPITHTLSTVPVIVPIVPKTDSSGKIILDGNILLGNITCVSKARTNCLFTKLPKECFKKRFLISAQIKVDKSSILCYTILTSKRITGGFSVSIFFK